MALDDIAVFAGLAGQLDDGPQFLISDGLVDGGEGVLEF